MRSLHRLLKTESESPKPERSPKPEIRIRTASRHRTKSPKAGSHCFRHSGFGFLSDFGDSDFGFKGAARDLTVAATPSHARRPCLSHVSFPAGGALRPVLPTR